MFLQYAEHSNHQVSFKYGTKLKAIWQNTDATCIVSELGLGHITLQSSPLTRPIFATEMLQVHPSWTIKTDWLIQYLTSVWHFFRQADRKICCLSQQLNFIKKKKKKTFWNCSSANFKTTFRIIFTQLVKQQRRRHERSSQDFICVSRSLKKISSVER